MTMMTIIEQVEKWYQENEQHIASLASKAEIHTNVIDPIRAAVVIEIETPTLVASITLWSKGDVCVLGLYKESKKDFTLVDRTIKSR